jgi:hypothetical protein
VAVAVAVLVADFPLWSVIVAGSHIPAMSVADSFPCWFLWRSHPGPTPYPCDIADGDVQCPPLAGVLEVAVDPLGGRCGPSGVLFGVVDGVIPDDGCGLMDGGRYPLGSRCGLMVREVSPNGSCFLPSAVGGPPEVIAFSSEVVTVSSEVVAVLAVLSAMVVVSSMVVAVSSVVLILTVGLHGGGLLCGGGGLIAGGGSSPGGGCGLLGGLFNYSCSPSTLMAVSPTAGAFSGGGGGFDFPGGCGDFLGDGCCYIGGGGGLLCGGCDFLGGAVGLPGGWRSPGWWLLSPWWRRWSSW